MSDHTRRSGPEDRPVLHGVDAAVWDGVTGFGPCIAIGLAADVDTESSPAATLPEVLGFASNSWRGLVTREHLGRFVKAHSACTFVGYDGPRLFLLADRFFRESGDGEAR